LKGAGLSHAAQLMRGSDPNISQSVLNDTIDPHSPRTVSRFALSFYMLRAQTLSYISTPFILRTAQIQSTGVAQIVSRLWVQWHGSA